MPWSSSHVRATCPSVVRMLPIASRRVNFPCNFACERTEVINPAWALLARSKRGTRSMPAWLSSGTRQRTKRLEKSDSEGRPGSTRDQVALPKCSRMAPRLCSLPGPGSRATRRPRCCREALSPIATGNGWAGTRAHERRRWLARGLEPAPPLPWPPGRMAALWKVLSGIDESKGWISQGLRPR